MSRLTPEGQQWLRDNREDYEFYLLHAILHSPEHRSSLLMAPVGPDDFRREEYSLVIGAMHKAVAIGRAFNEPVPFPPSFEYLRTYLESAAKEEGSDDDTIDEATDLIKELQSPKYLEQHYCVKPYFQAWYGSVHAKRAALEIQMDEVPDVHGALGQVHKALAAAAQASIGSEDDPHNQFLDGEELERQLRRPTGIHGLDDSLNGGWGRGECTLMFSGTKGGKSIAAGQCGWHEASHSKGHPLIVSTELLPKDYGVRIVSNACAIPINILQDCENFAQIRQAVAQAPAHKFKLPKVESVLQTFRERIRIAKVSPDEGMEARSILERELLTYERIYGCLPTWVCLDWLGTVADVNSQAKGGSSDRAAAWEGSATGCVKFAEETGIPTLVLAQAVNDAQLKRILTLPDIGIAKGIGKNMTTVIGITNTIDKAGIRDAEMGKSEMPRSMFLEDQFFCVCAARKGEGNNIPVRRDFRYQRFIARPRD